MPAEQVPPAAGMSAQGGIVFPEDESGTFLNTNHDYEDHVPAAVTTMNGHDDANDDDYGNGDVEDNDDEHDDDEAKRKRSKKNKKKQKLGKWGDNEIHNKNEVPSDLTIWNLAAFSFQFISSVPLFWFASNNSDKHWYLYTNFPQSITTTGGAEDDPDTFDIPNPQRIASFNLTWYSAVFILLSGIYHLSVAALPGVQDAYEYYLQRHQNPFRWFEYSFSASLMRIMIAQLAGVTDLHLILSIFIMSMTTMVLGACHESVNAKWRADGSRRRSKRRSSGNNNNKKRKQRNAITYMNQNWFPYFVSWIPQLGSWLIIWWYFLATVARDDSSSRTGRGAIWATIFLQFTLDASFAVVFHLQWAKTGIFADYIMGEKTFVVLSFVSKALLAWINLGAGSR